MRALDVCSPKYYLDVLKNLYPVALACQSLASGRLRRIPLEWTTNEFAFSFASHGWNYFRALVAEHEKNPKVCLGDSTFWRFFQHESIRSVRYLNDILFLHDPKRRR